MRNGTDESVQNAVKAFSSQLYQDIYGGPFGFDQQKFDNLRMKYTQEYEDATNPEVEMKSVLSAQGILSEKTDQEDSRGDLVSLIRSFKLQISSICEEMYQLTTKLSLVGNDQGVI